MIRTCPPLWPLPYVTMIWSFSLSFFSGRCSLWKFIERRPQRRRDGPVERLPSVFHSWHKYGSLYCLYHVCHDVSIHTGLIDSDLREAMASYGPMCYGQHHRHVFPSYVDNGLLLLSLLWCLNFWKISTISNIFWKYYYSMTRHLLSAFKTSLIIIICCQWCNFIT